MSDPHFLVDSVADATIRLDPSASHHAIRVLRIRVGDPVTLATGSDGTFASGVVVDADAAGMVVEVRSRREVPRPQPRITVAFALTKGAKPEFTVEKLTELGVDRIIPWASARSVVEWDATKRARHGDRMRATAIGAVQQSRRAWLPEVLDPVTGTDELLERIGDDEILVLDRDGDEPLPEALEHAVTLVIGPEGGLTTEEMRALGGHVVCMLDGVLRAETAAIAAAALVADRRNRAGQRALGDKLDRR